MQETLVQKKEHSMELCKEVKELQRTQKRAEKSIVLLHSGLVGIPQDKLKTTLEKVSIEENNLADILKKKDIDNKLMHQKEKLIIEYEAKIAEKEKELSKMPSVPADQSTEEVKLQLKIKQANEAKEKAEGIRDLVVEEEKAHIEKMKALNNKLLAQKNKIDTVEQDKHIADHRLKEVMNILECQRYKEEQRKKKERLRKALQEGKLSQRSGSQANIEIESDLRIRKQRLINPKQSVSIIKDADVSEIKYKADRSDIKYGTESKYKSNIVSHEKSLKKHNNGAATERLGIKEECMESDILERVKNELGVEEREPREEVDEVEMEIKRLLDKADVNI